MELQDATNEMFNIEVSGDVTLVWTPITVPCNRFSSFLCECCIAVTNLTLISGPGSPLIIIDDQTCLNAGESDVSDQVYIVCSSPEDRLEIWVRIPSESDTSRNSVTADGSLSTVCAPQKSTPTTSFEPSLSTSTYENANSAISSSSHTPLFSLITGELNYWQDLRDKHVFVCIRRGRFSCSYN